MTVCEEAALQFESFDHLRERCKMDSILTSQIRKLTCSKVLAQLVSVTDQANNYLNKGKAEEAYQLFRRAYDICEIINSKFPNETSFRNSPDGRRYFDLSNKILSSLDNLNEELQLRYTLRESDKQNITQKLHNLDLSINNEDSKPSKLKEISTLSPKSDKDDFGQYIKAQQLVQFVENKNASALILDYRTERTKFIDYRINPNAISVVQLPASELSPGCLLSMLPFLVDLSVRPLLLRIRQFDLVVLMGDTHEMEKPLEELPKNSHTWILMEALTTYNLREFLKRRPVILKGGFKNWDLAYSYYTKGETRFNFEQTFHEQFGSSLAKALKESKLDISYPNLNNNFSIFDKTPLSFYNNQEIIDENQRISQAVVRNVKIRKIDDVLDTNQSSILKNSEEKVDENIYFSTITNRRDVFPLENNKKIPSVDRSTKPSIQNINKSLPFPKTLLEENRALSVSPTNILSNKENFASISTEIITDLPQPAKKINSEFTISSQLKRPPIPDRSTKGQHFTGPPEFFQHIYHAMINEIYKSSRLGKTNSGYTGLYNLGNTCFMNSTLQALFNTPILIDLFSHQNIGKYINEANALGSRGVISGCFAALTDCIWSGDFLAIRPELFLETFAHRVNSDLADRRQHDAQEFQIFLLDALLEDTNKKGDSFAQDYNGLNLEIEAQDYLKKSKLYSSSILNDIFNIHTISRISCTICSTSSVTFEKMNQIAVELPLQALKDYTTLMECLQNHFNDLILEGQSRWKCPKCAIPQVAGRSIKIWSLPPVLVIHMKRFSPDRGEFVKNEIEVGYDISNLDMSRFLHEKAPKSKSIYTLYAVTNHDGRLNSGHYTAFVKNYQSQEWLKFDDDNCSRISSSSIKTKKAFVLYYTNQKCGKM